MSNKYLIIKKAFDINLRLIGFHWDQSWLDKITEKILILRLIYGRTYKRNNMKKEDFNELIDFLKNKYKRQQ